MAAIQAVAVRGYEERTEPKAHTVYKIEVKAHVRSWLVWRRYSEFDDLDSELERATGASPPVSLPPKHALSIFRSHSDPALLEERRTGLEAYLRSIISSKDDRWRECYALKQFLGVPVGKQSVSTPEGLQFTPATWIDELSAIQHSVRDIRADVSKRDALLDQPGDGPAAHKSNLAAKTKLASLIPRIGVLAKGLQRLAMNGLSEGELQRRTDMVARVQNDCETLTQQVHAVRFSANRGAQTFARTASEAARNELLGSQNNAPLPITRRFGAQVPATETEETRPLDNAGLFGMQEAQMQMQDNQLAQLTTILQRQRQLGEAIGNEIAVQNEMLDDLNQNVDRVSGKLRASDKQMRRLG